MNEKFNKNAKVENFTTMLGIAVRLIVIDPYCFGLFSVLTEHRSKFVFCQIYVIFLVIIL